MLSLQTSMNIKVDSNWVEARYPYLRAVIIEAAEAIEHHGWKWWKKQEKDLPQLQMELIDIWHFILSEILLRNQADQDKSLTALTDSLSDSSTQNVINFDLPFEPKAAAVPVRNNTTCIFNNWHMRSHVPFMHITFSDDIDKA